MTSHRYCLQNDDTSHDKIKSLNAKKLLILWIYFKAVVKMSDSNKDSTSKHDLDIFAQCNVNAILGNRYLYEPDL